MKNYYIFLTLLIFLFGNTVTKAQQDSALFYQVEGRIVDKNSGRPVVYASMIISGTNTGTVANMEGEFIIKIPHKNLHDSIVISSIGYKNKVLRVEELSPEKNLIKLEAASIQLSEVNIRYGDAREILIAAMDKIRDNNKSQPYMLTAFYRESIQRKRKYVAVSEAVLDTYKSSYTNPFERDRIQILKARKSTDFQKKDTLALRLQGGPYSMFRLDFVKNPTELLEREILRYYWFEINDYVIIDNRLAYVISFEQLPEVEVPLYKGRFFIEVDNLAFLGAEFQINADRIHKASEYMVQQKPPGVQVDIEKARYKVSYRYFGGNWHLSYVRTELALFIKWKKKHFRSKYTTIAEMAVTDMDTLNVTKFKNQNTFGKRDIFIEEVGNFEDAGFWGEYNIIRPEESIQSAVKRMGRKLKRKTANGS